MDQQLRAKQSKLRKESSTKDAADSREQNQSTPTDSSLPRERPEVLNDPSQEHLAPEVYWITPQHVTMDVMELADGWSTFSAICNQHGLRTGECLSLQCQFSQPSYYAEKWTNFVRNNPVLLYIEPPPVANRPAVERRPVALFCLAAALHQLENGRHFVLVHPVNSTLWAIPQAPWLSKLSLQR